MDIIDDASIPPPARDGSEEDGRSALLLVESLIHGLVAVKAIERQQAIEIVNVAAEIKLELAHERGVAPAEAAASARALTTIEQTLRSDVYQETEPR